MSRHLEALLHLSHVLASDRACSARASQCVDVRLLTPVVMGHTVVASGTTSSRPRPRKPHERQPVADLILDLLIGQVVKRL
jgi:hypothetical protein